MDKFTTVVYKIVTGSSKDRIFDAFKYSRGGQISLSFELKEAGIRPWVGNGHAIANMNFFISLIEYTKRSDDRKIHVAGDCDLFYYKDSDYSEPEWGNEYHVDFTMVYDTESREGAMVCYNFRDCYYDPCSC